MFKHVLMQQMRFVDEQHGMHLVVAERVHVRVDRIDDSGRRRRRREAEREADVAVEVPTSERHVVAIRESESVLRKSMSERAQDARLADSGLADEDRMTALATRLDEAVDRAGTRGGDPQVSVTDLLRKRRAESGRRRGGTALCRGALVVVGCARNGTHGSREADDQEHRDGGEARGLAREQSRRGARALDQDAQEGIIRSPTSASCASARSRNASPRSSTKSWTRWRSTP